MRLAIAFIAAIMGCMVLLKTHPEWSLGKYLVYGYAWSVAIFLAELLTR